MTRKGECPCGVMVKAQDCDIELQAHHYVPFQTNTLRKGMKPLIFRSIDKIVPLLSFSNRKL